MRFYFVNKACLFGFVLENSFAIGLVKWRIRVAGEFVYGTIDGGRGEGFGVVSVSDVIKRSITVERIFLWSSTRSSLDRRFCFYWPIPEFSLVSRTPVSLRK